MSKKVLVPVDPLIFENPKMTSFDFFCVDIPSIPLKQDLISQIGRAKFSRCQLEHIPSGLEAYHCIKQLDLSENNFSIILSSEIHGLIILQMVDFSMNFLKTIESGLPATITYIDLSYNPEIDVQSVWDLYLPKLETLKVAYCEIAELPQSLPAWNATLKYLNLEGNYLSSIPEAITMLPLIEEIIFFGNMFKTSILPHFTHNLKSLSYSYNPIQSFEHNDEICLQTMNLSYCLLNQFPREALSIQGLRVLLLSNNNIQGILDVEIPPLIAVLDLSKNRIDSLSESFISSCGKVSILNLSNNRLRSISDSFPPNTNFSHLILSYNMIEDIPLTMLNSKSLEKLNMSHNMIKSLPDFRMPQIRDVDLSFNELSSLSDGFSYSSFLISINVSHNKLSDLPQSLSGCRRMLDLFASCNQFITIPRCVLSFAQLRCLEFSHNKLTSLPESMCSLYFLKTLDVSNNHFPIIPKVISSIPSLKSLTLSHNLIESIPSDFCFPKSLVNLDLSFNKISSIPPLSIATLSSLSLECNQLTSIPDIKLPSIHCVSISGNPISECSKFIEQILQSEQIRIIECFQILASVPKPINSLLHIMSNDSVVIPSQLGIGYASAVGSRPSMEDTVVIYSNGKPKSGLFAVFDGHAGFASANNASSLLVEEYKKINQFDFEQWPALFCQSITNIHEGLRSLGVEDGCTAIAAIVEDNHFITLGVGDSRIIRIKNDSSQRMTQDQKPLNEGEFQRLKKAKLGVNCDGRVKKKLAIARSLGDFWCGEGIYLEPESKRFEIETDDIGLILACDGLWDVVDDEYAANVVRTAKSAQDAAESLKNMGIGLNSGDNVSVIVVLFNPDPTCVGYCPKNTVEEIPVVYLHETTNDDTQAPPPLPSSRRRR